MVIALVLLLQLSQNIVTGRVTTGTPPVPVAGATVRMADATTTTDGTGTFRLALDTSPLSARRLVISAPGFLDETIEFSPDGSASIDVVLRPNPVIREELTVTAESDRLAAAPPVLTVSPNLVRTVSGAVDNVFRVLQTLPGISATDDFGSRLSVRGGGPDQNLTVMDGVEIHNPYRLFGLTSAFNPETIERFELTPGAFSARYGDRLSSIFVVENRAGNPREALAGSAALSVTDANVVLEGRLPAAMPGSWLVTGRRTYYDVFAERVTDNDLPSFGDVQTKVVLTPTAGREVTFFGLRSREATDAEFEGDAAGDRIGLENRSRNDVVSLSLRTPLGPRARSATTVSWYRYGDALDVDGSVRNEGIRSNTPGDDAFDRAAIVFTRAIDVRDVAFRQELTIAPSAAHVLDAGVELHALRTSWGWTITGDRNTAAANGSSVIGGASLPALLNSSVSSHRAGAWLEDTFTWSPRVTLVGGVRVDWGAVPSETMVSPRARLVISVTPSTRVRVAGGRYTQSPGYEKLLQSDYFVDLSDRGTLGLSSERARHLVGGLEHNLSPATVLRLEGYYKSFNGLVIGRLETPAETSARVGQYAFPPELTQSVPADPVVTTVPVNGGGGRSYGMDLYVEKRAIAARDRLSGWAAYTWGKSVLDQYGGRYRADYDRRHALSLVSTWRALSRVSLGVTLRIASGFPETLPMGVRAAATRADGAADGAPASLVPARDPTGALLWTADYGGVGNLNAGRLPLYARLDIRATYAPSPTSRWELYGEVINALNRENAGTLSPALEYDPAGDRPSLSLTADGGLPRLPTFGFRIRF